MLGTIVGWSSFGLAARCWQLAIMKRNIFENLGGHAISMSAFGGLGYLYYNADKRVLELLDKKKEALWETRKASAGGAPADEGDDE